MGIGTMFKANKAYRSQKNGQTDEAIRLYEECFADGLNDPRYVLAYAVLIIRKGEYQKAKDFLVKHQKAPGMSPDQKINLIVDYAACCFRLGEMDKGITKLEELYRKGPNGLIYQTLGYLYVEKYDRKGKEAFIAAETARQAEETARIAAEEAEEQAALEAETEEDRPRRRRKEREPLIPPEEQWEAGKNKALEFNREAVEYDEDDPVCLDNLAQVYYRVLGDEKEAKGWFEKAHAMKEEQIDTLYFLSRYDLKAGDREAALKKLEKAAEGRFSPLNYCDLKTIQAEIATLKGER